MRLESKRSMSSSSIVFPPFSGSRAGRTALCYSALMKREDVVAFARRDWGAIEASKRQRLAAQKASMTPADALRVGDELRNYAKSLHPNWPSEEDRRNDLAVHV